MASFPDQHRKTIQRLMSEDSWGAVEAFMEYYMLQHYATASIKRATEFDTVWYAAEAEGAKMAIVGFFREMEEEASRVETR